MLGLVSQSILQRSLVLEKESRHLVSLNQETILVGLEDKIQSTTMELVEIMNMEIIHSFWLSWTQDDLLESTLIMQMQSLLKF